MEFSETLLEGISHKDSIDSLTPRDYSLLLFTTSVHSLR